MSKLLATISGPDDLKYLNRQQLHDLSDELRQFILQSVSQTGGHLSSNLGTVELSIALHYVFNTPTDKIIWDVGHQSYPHKVLTGRREQLHTIRQLGGISGFPKRQESPYDAFGTAHSSTSISAALGMAVAARNLGLKQRRHIAVIGDGAMTAGMVFEALNNAGVTPDVNLLVILNDNNMSISPPVGALNQYLVHLLNGRFYREASDFSKVVLEHMPAPMADLARKVKGHAKSMIGPTTANNATASVANSATMFEEFGFNYIGPVDGHDLDALIPALENCNKAGGLQFLHIVTRKGQGYKLAEADPVLYHGPGKFDPDVGIQSAGTKKPRTFTQVFSKWICDRAAQDSKLYAITPAMREGSGLVEFEAQFPERYFDVGIAEQHAVTFAAGIACEGLKPVVAIYSTFLQRAYDQLIHDVALQNLDVTFALDRAGLVGADGATHAGNYDIAYLRCIPNMVVAAPSDRAEARLLLNTCYQYQGPASVRYPRGSGVGDDLAVAEQTVPLGKAVLRHQGASPIAILCFGPLLQQALPLAQKYDITVVDMRFVKPLDGSCIAQLAQTHQAFVTLEEGALMGGAGSAVAEFLNAHNLDVELLQLGFPDRFIDHGEQKQLLQQLNLHTEGIEASIQKRFSKLLEQKG